MYVLYVYYVAKPFQLAAAAVSSRIVFRSQIHAQQTATARRHGTARCFNQSKQRLTLKACHLHLYLGMRCMCCVLYYTIVYVYFPYTTANCLAIN